MTKTKHWDLITVGAGPAGLTAGIYGARSGLKMLVLEEKLPGGQAAETPLVENYPGFESIDGRDLIDKMTEHCKKAGAQVNELEKVVEIDFKDEKKKVKTNKTTYTASALIIASGSHHKTLGVPGENEFRGRGVSYCAVCDGAFFKGRKVLIVGGGYSAVVSALYLANLASDVKLAHRRSQLRAEGIRVKDLQTQKVGILWNTELKEVKGDVRVRSAIIANNKTGKTKEINVDGIFVQVGEVPNSQFAKEAGIEVDDGNFIVTDARQRTNIRGVYAAGDVTNGPIKQIGTAVGQAIIAATEAFGYVKRPYYYKGWKKAGSNPKRISEL
jgi:thioredoxin reductase (NADPH)